MGNWTELHTLQAAAFGGEDDVNSSFFLFTRSRAGQGPPGVGGQKELGPGPLGWPVMARLCPSLLLLVATVALASSAVHAWGTPKVVRKFQDIPKSYVYVQQAVWFAMKEYNKASSDKFAFKVVEILKSQEQITDSLDYLIEAKIVRTTCKKVSGEHENCSEQQDPQMQKMFYCTFIVASKPWNFELKLLKKECRPV
nr:cystatin-13-like isoform X2 [Camelus dromedarius]